MENHRAGGVLLVDADPLSRRVLQIGLLQAGYQVTTAASGSEALAALESHSFAVVICDAQLPDLPGFELCRQVTRRRPSGVELPFIVLCPPLSIDDRIRALELGLEDCLVKPVHARELVARVEMVRQRSLRQRLESRDEATVTVAGRLSDLGVVDLLRALDRSRRSAVIHLHLHGDSDEVEQRGAIYFRQGRPVGAEAGRARGRVAIHRLLSWAEGSFEVEFRRIDHPDLVGMPLPALLAEGMTRLDACTRLLEALPPLDTVLVVDLRGLVRRAGDLTVEARDLLRLFDGWRSLGQVIEDCDLPDLEALQIVRGLAGEGLLLDREGPERPAENEAQAETDAASSPLPPARRRSVLLTVGGTAAATVLAVAAFTTISSGGSVPLRPAPPPAEAPAAPASAPAPLAAKAERPPPLAPAPVAALETVQTLLSKASAAAEQGREPASLAWAARAIALDPTVPDAYLFVGNAHQAAGRHQEARAAYRKYLELAPTGKYAADLRAILQSL